MIWSLLAPLWQAIKAPRILAGIAGVLLVGGLLFAVSHYRSRVHELEALRKADAARIALATAQATTAQIAVNHEPAAKSQTIAENSRDQSQAYYDEGRRAGLAYAAAHRVRPEAVGCPVTAPGVFGTDRVAAVNDGPGDAAGLVALSQADYDLLVFNSNRLAQVHQDADALIAAGAAVPLSKETHP